MIGFDYTERIPPAALKAAGCSVVIRYTTWSGWGKSLTPGEADELHAAEIAVAANFESTADRMKGGPAAGRADALEARGHLSDDHLPTNLRVWFSADWDVQPSEVPAVMAYLQAAAAVLGKDRVGLYGGLRAVAAAAGAGYAIWQTVAWSGGQWDPRAVARQTGRQLVVGGVQVDENEIINLAGLGAWGGPTTGGPDVNLTDTVTISQGFADRYPAVANPRDGFTAGAQPTVATLLEGAALRAVNNEYLLQQVLAKVGGGTDVAKLAADLGPLLHPTTDVAALATALAPHVGAPDPAAFAAALAPHIKVTSQ